MLERGGERVIGKSYDWHMGQGLVMVNKRGVAKQSLPAKPGDVPRSWLSRHASVTFNQYGREFPTGGMNDAGLVVEVMWLDSSEYEQADERPTLNELQWIQYQLDTFATVAEMTAAAPVLRVSPVYARVHYLACDKTGRLRGLRARRRQAGGDAGRARADEPQLRRIRRMGGEAGAVPPTGVGIAAALRARRAPRGDAAQRRPGDRRVRGARRRPLVAEPVEHRLRSGPPARQLPHPCEPRASRPWISRKLDASCAQPVELLDIDADASGDVASRLRPYDQATNRALIERSVRRIRDQLPAGAVDMMVAYPAALACKAP